MLKITIEHIPSGKDNAKRILGIMEITNVSKRRSPLAEYEIALTEDCIEGVSTANISHYPRWSSSIWDLVIRGIAKVLTGKEWLPPRPELVSTRIYKGQGYDYVLLTEIPEPIRTAFIRNLWRCDCPSVDAAYAEDWGDFLAGRR